MRRGFGSRLAMALLMIVVCAAMECDDDRPTGLNNQAPVAVDDFATTMQGVPVTVDVLANDSDPDGDDLSVFAASIRTPPPGASVVINGDGSLTVDPGPDFVGTLIVDYDVADDVQLPLTASAVLTVTVTPAPAGNPPVAVDDQATTQQGTAVTVDVLANDSDPDDDPLTIISADFVGTPPSGSSVTINGDGTLTINPGPSFVGTLQIGYTIQDPTELQASATLTVTVVAPSPGATVTVNVRDEAGNAVAPDAAAFQIGDLNWSELAAMGVGQFSFDVPAGENRFGLLVRCGDLLQGYQLSTGEATNVNAFCPNPTASAADFSFTWSGVDNLGAGASFGVTLHGRVGFIASGSGASGGMTVAGYPAVPQDLILVGRADGVIVGAQVMRGVTPVQGGTFSYDFTAADQGGSAPVDPFTVPGGFSGGFFAAFSTPGAVVDVGAGTDAGGTFYTVPNTTSDDVYVGLASASGSGMFLTSAVVSRQPSGMSFDIPVPLSFPAPAPSATPTFTGLSSSDPSAFAFRITLNLTTNLLKSSRTFISQGWLGAATSYTVPDASGLSGFENSGFASQDLVTYLTEVVAGDINGDAIVSLEDYLTFRRALGVPLVDGLGTTSAGVLGSFQVP